jgi:hypothetical protein
VMDRPATISGFQIVASDIGVLLNNGSQYVMVSLFIS